MATVQQLIDGALRLIGVIASGETPSAQESNDALGALNQMLLSWSAAGVPVYQVSRDTLSLTGAASYTIGPSGAIPTARPVKLKSAQVSSGGVSVDVEIVTAERWTRFKDRTLTGKFASELYYDGGFPLGTIALWPAPVTGGTLELYSLKPLTAFTSLSDTINLPPGYEHALRFALASVLAPEYGATMSPDATANAQQAMTSIGTLNTQVLGGPLPASGAAPAVPA